MIKNSNSKLTEGRLLTKNVVLNFLGKIFPLLAGIISIPILINNIGTERFGVLAILWLLIGYFGILDFGFSKSIVYELGKDLKSGAKNISETTGTITTILFIAGIFFGALIIFAAQFFTNKVFSLSPALIYEVKVSFIILGIGTPVTMIGSALRGILETFQDFKRISLIDALSGGLTYFGLAAVSLINSNLITLVIVLIGIKLCIGIAFYLFSKDFIEGKVFTFTINREKVKSAFNFGKWIAVSNVIAPIMGQIDRYIIGAVITMTAVTYYTAPFDMIQKISLIPISITAVLFPAFTLASRSIEKSSSIFSNSILATIVLVFPLTGILVFFAEEILFIWLGQEFVEQSTFVLQILIIGAFVNSIATIPFTFIQGLGLPHITAKIHLSEFVTYVPALWLLINAFGILGAAFARTIRVFIDWLVLIFIAKRKINSKAFIIETIVLTGSLIGVYFASILSLSLMVKIISSITLLTAYFYIVWTKYLEEENKLLIRKKLFGRKSHEN